MDHPRAERAGTYWRTGLSHGRKGRSFVSLVCGRCRGDARTRHSMGRQILEPVSAMAQTRPAAWRWWVCGLLLFASMINYMDRQTLANAAVRITTQFGLNQE